MCRHRSFWVIFATSVKLARSLGAKFRHCCGRNLTSDVTTIAFPCILARPCWLSKWCTSRSDRRLVVIFLGSEWLKSKTSPLYISCYFSTVIIFSSLTIVGGDVTIVYPIACKFLYHSLKWHLIVFSICQYYLVFSISLVLFFTIYSHRR